MLRRMRKKFKKIFETITIGPYKEQSVRQEVEEGEFPHDNPLQGAVNALRSQGYKV